LVRKLIRNGKKGERENEVDLGNQCGLESNESGKMKKAWKITVGWKGMRAGK
jgi:hypothetical protein